MSEEVCWHWERYCYKCLQGSLILTYMCHMRNKICVFKKDADTILKNFFKIKFRGLSL